jgi:hypothetical protein
MRPNIPIVFQTMALDLMMRVIPAISPSYHQGTVGMIATMLAIAADEWDRGASRRIEENQKLRELFANAAPVVKDLALGGRLKELAATREEDFRVSALEKNNCTLRAALIELHSQIESQTGAEARKVEDEIWKELVASTERRRLSTAQF